MVTPEECIFCKIVRGEIPSRKVHEDKEVLAILDANPASLGHVLVLPKKHFANIYDIDNASLVSVANIVKLMADRAKSRLGAEGVNVLQNNGRHAGQIVEHLHIHVIPRYENDGISLHLPRAKISEEDLKSAESKLKEEESKPKDSSSMSIGPGW